LADAAVIDASILDALRHIPPDVPMMDVMRSGCSLLSHWDVDANDNRRNANLHKAERLLGQLPIIMAARHRLRSGREPIAPTGGQSLAANALWMLTGQPPSEQHVRAMDASLILYAEHELNASTFTARVVCSTLSDLHSSVTAAIGALKGPLHGGANERVMGVLAEVGSADRAEAWVRNALALKVRIMGFGHRVYKAGDPRARFLKPYCTRLAAQTNNQDMERMADCIERIVVAEKKLPPNLDWPSARLYHYMGLPIDLYTPLFVVSRAVGWCAHVIEQLDHNRLIRPRSNYIGPAPRVFVPLDQRD
jgi:citrate synthase